MCNLTLFVSRGERALKNNLRRSKQSPKFQFNLHSGAKLRVGTT